MNNKNNSSLNETSILIDSGSNCSIFKNSDRLANIRNCDELLRVYTKFGYQDSNMKGHYKNSFVVWFNPESMLNILSVSQVSKRYRITMDTVSSTNMKVH